MDYKQADFYLDDATIAQIADLAVQTGVVFDDKAREVVAAGIVALTSAPGTNTLTDEQSAQISKLTADNATLSGQVSSLLNDKVNLQQQLTAAQQQASMVDHAATVTPVM